MQSSPESQSSFFSVFNRVLGIGLSLFTVAFASGFIVAGIRNLGPNPKDNPAAAPAAAAPAAPAAAAAPAAPATTPAASPAPAAAPAAGGTAKDRGKIVYSTICIPCHQPTGMGLPNMFPPLVGSDWLKVKKADRLIRMVLHGLTGPIKLNGAPFTTPAPLMPGQAAVLSDQQIADVLTYVRAEYGGGASEVTPDQVKAIREAEKGRAAMWTEAELEKISVE